MTASTMTPRPLARTDASILADGLGGWLVLIALALLPAILLGVLAFTLAYYGWRAARWAVLRSHTSAVRLRRWVLEADRASRVGRCRDELADAWAGVRENAGHAVATARDICRLCGKAESECDCPYVVGRAALAVALLTSAGLLLTLALLHAPVPTACVLLTAGMFALIARHQHALAEAVREPGLADATAKVAATASALRHELRTHAAHAAGTFVAGVARPALGGVARSARWFKDATRSYQGPAYRPATAAVAARRILRGAAYLERHVA